jgi:hypothetical protein
VRLSPLTLNVSESSDGPPHTSHTRISCSANFTLSSRRAFVEGKQRKCRGQRSTCFVRAPLPASDGTLASYPSPEAHGSLKDQRPTLLTSFRGAPPDTQIRPAARLLSPEGSWSGSLTRPGCIPPKAAARQPDEQQVKIQTLPNPPSPARKNPDGCGRSGHTGGR